MHLVLTLKTLKVDLLKSITRLTLMKVLHSEQILKEAF